MSTTQSTSVRNSPANPLQNHDFGDRSGLTSREARYRLDTDGHNAMPTQGRHGLSLILWETICEPMFLLLAAAGALYLVMGSYGDALLLLVFVGVVMGITIVQGRRTERALEALRDMASPRALVVRDGQQQRISATEVVRGDVILLAEGDRVPGDAVLRKGLNLMADESLLTGESVPVEKRPSDTAITMDRPGGNGLPSVFSGTLIVGGQGMAEVLATGLHAELGRIGTALSQVKPERTRLQRETGQLVRMLAVVGLSLCCMVVVAYALTRGGDVASWKQGLLAGITMAMAVLPEELPVILTIFLALGAWRISRSRVLTRRLPAIETLGAATVLCTDKTGTLTCNQMTVTRIVIAERQIDVSVTAGGQPLEVQTLLDIAVLASRTEPFDPMERAIHVAGEQALTASLLRHPGWTMEREYPLTPNLLAVTQVWQRSDGQPHLIASKGAPEAIAKLCNMSSVDLAALLVQVTALANDGLRVLAVASGSIPVDGLPANHADLKVEFLGLIGLSDPLRVNVPAAVAECQSAGIRVVMITGDYPATARIIARQAGIAADPDIITGSELQSMTDADLAQRVRTVQVFARVAPEQKLRLVQALKANHEVVAMTGDGVNDAPALKAAHIGIAMGGRGTDVAREAAALVLLDDDFASVVSAIKMGRRIFDNIKKSISFTFAAHVPIAGLSILPVFIPDWPLLLLPVHIVFLEMVINPACALIFEAEPAELDIMLRPPRDPKERLFSKNSIAISVLQGLSVLTVCVGIFIFAKVDHGDDAARALTFTALVTSFIAIIFTNRSWSRSVVEILRTPNAAQWWVVMGTSCFLALILLLPMAHALFHFAPLHGLDLLLSIAAGAACVGWLEGLKAWRRRPGHRIESALMGL